MENTGIASRGVVDSRTTRPTRAVETRAATPPGETQRPARDAAAPVEDAATLVRIARP